MAGSGYGATQHAAWLDDRGNYRGAQPPAKWDRAQNRPDMTALPFGVSYEKYRNPGPEVSLEFEGEPESQITPKDETVQDGLQWGGGYESMADKTREVDTPVTGGESVGFWNWHFIEEGWDYGFVEALVDGEWVTVEVTNDAGDVVCCTSWRTSPGTRATPTSSGRPSTARRCTSWSRDVRGGRRQTGSSPGDLRSMRAARRPRMKAPQSTGSDPEEHVHARAPYRA